MTWVWFRGPPDVANLGAPAAAGSVKATVPGGRAPHVIAHAHRQPARARHVQPHGHPVRRRLRGRPDGDLLSWAQLHEEARAVGAALQAGGSPRATTWPSSGPTSRALVTALQGCWLAGAASMVLPLPMRMGSLEAFVESTRARIRHGDAKLLLIDDLLAAFYEPVPGDPPTLPLTSVLPGPGNPGPEALEIPPHDPERLVILQYTSGSTSEPKGVMIPDRVFGANVDAAADGGRARAGRRHGVVAAAVPRHGAGRAASASRCRPASDLVQAAPQDFLAHPGHWMEWLSTYRRHGHRGPNFAWVLAARALRRLHGLDLSRLRIALSGAEPVDPAAVEAFVAAAAPLRLPARRGVPGLRHGRGRHRRHVPRAPAGPGVRRRRPGGARARSRRQARRDQRPGRRGVLIRRLPLLGRPVPGLEFRIVDPDSGEELPPSATSASSSSGARR